MYRYARFNIVFGIVLFVCIILFSIVHFEGIGSVITILFSIAFISFLISLFLFYKNTIVEMKVEAGFVIMKKSDGKIVKKNASECEYINLNGPRIVFHYQSDKTKYRIIRNSGLLKNNDIDISLITIENFPNAVIK